MVFLVWFGRVSLLQKISHKNDRLHEQSRHVACDVFCCVNRFPTGPGNYKLLYGLE